LCFSCNQVCQPNFYITHSLLYILSVHTFFLGFSLCFSCNEVWARFLHHVAFLSFIAHFFWFNFFFIFELQKYCQIGETISVWGKSDITEMKQSMHKLIALSVHIFFWFQLSFSFGTTTCCQIGEMISLWGADSNDSNVVFYQPMMHKLHILFLCGFGRDDFSVGPS
jgi:hypothetical protein